MTKKSLTILLILLFPFLMVSQAGADEVQPVLTIDGDELMIDTAAEISTFLGNVSAWYETFQIQSQKLVYDQKKQYVKMEGSVRMTGDGMQVSAQAIEVDLAKEFLTMSGSVEVFRQGQLVKGNLVTFDMKTKTLRVKTAHLEITETKKQ